MDMRWVKNKFLARGKHSSVFVGQPSFSAIISRPNIPRYVAIKSVPRNCYLSLMKEKEILYELRGCSQIVRSYDDDDFMCIDQDGVEHYNIVLEYADGGNLKQLIRSRGGYLLEREASWYVCMLLKGLSHVHKEGYVHCDMKLSNILVFNTPSSDEHKESVKYSVKIADFGLAKKSGEISYEVLELDYKNRGTLIYSSPESVVSGMHEAPMDIWSLGCMLVEMLLGDGGLWRKFRNVDERCLRNLIASYEDNKLSILLPKFYLSENAKDFVRRCLTKNVKERWTAKRLLKHPFITQNQQI